ncbi:MAG: cyclin-Y [archaeon]|nr:cyclin-Y [archaeon]
MIVQSTSTNHSTKISPKKNKTNQIAQGYQSSNTESTSSPSPRKKKAETNQLFHSSSTSSIYLQNTIDNPNTKSLIKGVSMILQIQLTEDNKLKRQISPSSDLYYFNEEKYIKESPNEFNKENIENIHKMPTLDDIHKFIEALFNCVQFAPECCVIALIYINRIISLTGLCLTATNWRPLVFISLMVSQKIWDDVPLSNKDFSSFYSFFDKQQVNTLEMKFLEMIQYNVFVELSTFMFFYLNLKELTFEEQSKKPMSKYEMDEIEFNIKWKGVKKKKRSKSADKEILTGQRENYVIS